MSAVTTILSIQSSVAYGHVGNSAATFPLMRMGVEVWPVLTVRKDPLVFAGATVVSSMAKILLVIIAAMVAQNIEALVRPAFGATLLAGSLAAIIIDIVVFQRGRIPYVSPPPSGGAGTPGDGVR